MPDVLMNSMYTDKSFVDLLKEIVWYCPLVSMNVIFDVFTATNKGKIDIKEKSICNIFSIPSKISSCFRMFFTIFI